jgi:hypothetical protein
LVEVKDRRSRAWANRRLAACDESIIILDLSSQVFVVLELLILEKRRQKAIPDPSQEECEPREQDYP